MQVTERFSYKQKPVYPGVYAVIMFQSDNPAKEVLFQGYSRWDGYCWSNAYYTVQDASTAKSSEVAYQNKVWWGVLPKNST